MGVKFDRRLILLFGTRVKGCYKRVNIDERVKRFYNVQGKLRIRLVLVNSKLKDNRGTEIVSVTLECTKAV